MTADVVITDQSVEILGTLRPEQHLYLNEASVVAWAGDDQMFMMGSGVILKTETTTFNVSFPKNDAQVTIDAKGNIFAGELTWRDFVDEDLRIPRPESAYEAIAGVTARSHVKIMGSTGDIALRHSDGTWIPSLVKEIIRLRAQIESLRSQIPNPNP